MTQATTSEVTLSGQAAGSAGARGQETAGPAEFCGQEETDPPDACGQEVETPDGSCGQEVAGPAEPGQGGAHYRRLDGLEMGAWRSFLAASTSVAARLNRDLEAGCGISMHEYEILVRLSEAPKHSMRMSALAEHVSHSRSRLTHTVGRMEKEGYVARVSCASDKRGVNCELTEAGLAFLRQAAPIHLDGVRRYVLDRLDRNQLNAMAELMSLIAEAP